MAPIKGRRIRGQNMMHSSAITTASGLLGYELETPARVIVPVITPLVNMLPRRKGVGVDIVHWKAITSFDSARNWGTLSDGGTPSSVTYAVAALVLAVIVFAPCSLALASVEVMSFTFT